MKKLSKFLILSLIIILSCSDDDNIVEPVTMIADAGTNQEVEPLDVVTLDGSKSQGPSGFTYEWTYSGDVLESEINFEGKTTVNPTFIPPKNDIYSFTLKISSGSATDEDQITVVTSGAIEIGGILNKDTELINIQPDASLPDYIVISDLVVPSGITLSIVEENVIIEFEENTGILVETGGTLSNIDETIPEGLDTEFLGKNGWKGILIDGGSIGLVDAKLENGGKSKFTGYEEAAVVTFAGEPTTLLEFSHNEFINSYSYDILVVGNVDGPGRVKNNQLSYSIPIKSPITFMGYWSSSEPNLFPAEFEYIHLKPSGADIKDEISITFSFTSGGKFFIDGDFWAGSNIFFHGGSTIYVKEGGSIVSDLYLNTSGTEDNPIIIDGLNSAHWKGIASARNTRAFFDYTTINNAGYGLIKVGSYEATVPAALSTSIDGHFTDCEIINSGGYGYYSRTEGNIQAQFRINNSKFVNTELAAIRVNVKNVESTIISKNHNNIFNLGENVPAILIDEGGTPRLPWYGLGDDNFYLIDAEIEYYNKFVLEEGVILKFRSDRSLIRNSINNPIEINGTSTNPVIFDGELGTPGSWGGLFLGCGFRINNLIIKNGGGFLLPNASEKGNVIHAFNGSSDEVLEFKNSTISNSLGYGIVIEQPTNDFDFEDPSKNNMFENNTLGDIIKP